MEEGAPIWIYCEAYHWPRWRDVRAIQVGMQNSGKEGLAMGRWCLQINNGVQRGLPQQATKVQIHTSSVSSKYLPKWHRLPIDPQRGRRLETFSDNSPAPHGHPRFNEQPKRKITSSSRPLPPFHTKQGRILQQS